MNRSKLLFAALAGTLMLPVNAQAQARAALINQARAEFSDETAVQILLSAQNPALGAPDSLWAVAAYDLGAALIRLEQRPLALVWLRWIARHGSRWPIDRAWYPRAVVDAYDEAARSVQAGAGARDVAVTTAWKWPTKFDAAATGTVEVTAPGTTAPLTIAVAGRNERASGSVTLPPGTYDLVVSAEGYQPARLTREILPGVATSLEFRLVAAAPPPPQPAPVTAGRTPDATRSPEPNVPIRNPWSGYKVRGIGYGAAVVGGGVLAMMKKTESAKVCGQQAGGYDCVMRTEKSPAYFVPGAALAGGAVLVAVVDAMLTARKAKSADVRIGGPGSNRDADTGVSLNAPAIDLSGARLGVELIRLRF